MTMASFDDFLAELKGEIKTLAEKSWKDFAAAAVNDSSAFIAKTQDDLKRWTKLLSDGSLTLQEFEFLVAAKKELAEMTALKQAGLAQVQRDRFINGLVGTIISSAQKVFL
jgi:hypothetical protein